MKKQVKDSYPSRLQLHFTNSNVGCRHPWLPGCSFFVCIILMSLFNKCRLYRDRSLLTWHNALLLWQIARDLLHALSHRHDNTWHDLCWTSRRHWLEQVGDSQLERELLTWSKQTEDSWLEPSIPWSQSILTLHTSIEPLPRPGVQVIAGG